MLASWRNQLNMIDAIPSGLIGYALITVNADTGIMGSDLRQPVWCDQGVLKDRPESIQRSLWFPYWMVLCSKLGLWKCFYQSDCFWHRDTRLGVAIVFKIIMLTAIYGIKALDVPNTIAVPRWLLSQQSVALASSKIWNCKSTRNAVSSPSMSFRRGCINN